MSLPRDTRGAVYTEFLICILPFFTVVLGLAQLALIGQASLVVQHAANAAARSAIVVLDEDPALYDRRPRMRLFPEGHVRRGGGKEAALVGMLGGGSFPLRRRGGPRIREIRLAAYMPLLAVAPSSQQLYTRREALNVARAVGTNSLTRAAFGMVYVLGGSSVTFPTEPGATTYRRDFRDAQQVTTRVTYAYPCAVPLASRILCDDYLELNTGVPITTMRELAARVRRGTASLYDLQQVQYAMDRVDGQSARLEASEPLLDDLAQAEMPGILATTVVRGTRFRLLRAEATLPIQAAPYPYQSEVRGRP